MAVETSADRAALLADFGAACVFGAAVFTAIPDSGFVEVNGVEDMHPLLHCRTADVSTLAHGDSGTVVGVAYSIVGIQPDGTGMTVLLLEAA